ncbi:hypothetical protein RHSIM_Rhsim05G0135100 [Rhododendron simsii]|uniref:Uncharacterized protein n=1 Tax=Rhododendron simsii TaxID=118357 RepID=A0A834GZ88_RHOSS|nr:hypothetical protein RHSIM_Rhsim05G0135100 [Rhododendron simsii]
MIVSKEEENATKIIPINQLQAYDRNWTIKVTTLRRGIVEPYSTSKGTDNMWKLILIDEQLSSMKKAVGVGTMVKQNVSEVILLTLWGDLAKNEGEELDSISKERPPIAVSRAKVTTYSDAGKLKPFIEMNYQFSKIECFKILEDLISLLRGTEQNTLITMYDNVDQEEDKVSTQPKLLKDIDHLIEKTFKAKLHEVKPEFPKERQHVMQKAFQAKLHDLKREVHSAILMKR